MEPVFNQVASHTTSLDGQKGIELSKVVHANKRTETNRYEGAFLQSRDAPAVAFLRISSEPPPQETAFPQAAEPGTQTATCLFPLDAVLPRPVAGPCPDTEQHGTTSDIHANSSAARQSEDTRTAPNSSKAGATSTKDGDETKQHISDISAARSRNSDDPLVFQTALTLSGGPVHNTTVHTHLLVVRPSYLESIGEDADSFAEKYGLPRAMDLSDNPILQYKDSQWHVASRFHAHSLLTTGKKVKTRQGAHVVRPLVVTLAVVGDIDLRASGYADKLEWRQSSRRT